MIISNNDCNILTKVIVLPDVQYDDCSKFLKQKAVNVDLFICQYMYIHTCKYIFFFIHIHGYIKNIYRNLDNIRKKYLKGQLFTLVCIT